MEVVKSLLAKYGSRRWLTTVAAVIFGVLIAKGAMTPDGLSKDLNETMQTVLRTTEVVAGCITVLFAQRKYNQTEADVDRSRNGTHDK